MVHLSSQEDQKFEVTLTIQTVKDKLGLERKERVSAHYSVVGTIFPRDNSNCGTLLPAVPQGEAQDLKWLSQATEGAATHLLQLTYPQSLHSVPHSLVFYPLLDLAMLCASPGNPVSLLPSALPASAHSFTQVPNGSAGRHSFIPVSGKWESLLFTGGLWEETAKGRPWTSSTHVSWCL